MGSDQSNQAKQESRSVKETSESAPSPADVPKAETSADGSEETKVETVEQAVPKSENQEATSTETSSQAEHSASGARHGSQGSTPDNGNPAFLDARIQRILDIELPVNVSFGTTRRPLSEVLKMGPGALLELDRLADEPVVLKVNNKVFAKGEIVDVDGYYGVQITEIVSPVQRITSLGESK